MPQSLIDDMSPMTGFRYIIYNNGLSNLLCFYMLMKPYSLLKVKVATENEIEIKWILHRLLLIFGKKWLTG